MNKSILKLGCLFIFVSCLFIFVVFYFTDLHIFIMDYLDDKSTVKNEKLHYTFDQIKRAEKGLALYFIDNNYFPPGYKYVGSMPVNLTTPVNYMIDEESEFKPKRYVTRYCNKLPIDPFVEGDERRFGTIGRGSSRIYKGDILKYITDGENFYLLYSAARDGKYDFDPEVYFSLEDIERGKYIDELRKGGGGSDKDPITKGDIIRYTRKDNNYLSWLERNNYFKSEDRDKPDE